MEFKLPKFVLIHDVVATLEELSVVNKGSAFIRGQELNRVDEFDEPIVREPPDKLEPIVIAEDIFTP